MSNRYKKIKVICPVCKKSNILDIPNAFFLQKKVGTIKIQVPPGAVCSDHQFIIFLDSKGSIRGYEKIDIMMVKPRRETKREVMGLLTLRKLIKMFGTYCILSLVHAKIFNYPIFIVVDEDFKYSSDLLNSIGNQILPERYRGGKTLHLYKETDYDNIELNIKDALLLDIHRRILQIPWEQKLKFEEFLVKEALEIIDEQEQLFVIKQKVSPFIKEAECALNILEKTNQISKKELIKQISKELMKKKISNYRLNLIIEFINQRFTPKLTAKISKLKKK